MKHKKHIIYIDHTGNYITLCRRKQYIKGIFVWRLNDTLQHLKELKEDITDNINSLSQDTTDIIKEELNNEIRYICKNCFKNYRKNLSGEIKQY